MSQAPAPALARRTWQVGALCRAVADALESRFNPVAVRGEISGFSRASSGHCYFTLKDPQGQLRSAMFRRAAGLLDFTPQDGELVEVQGRLAVYEPRGDLQLVVESMTRAGQGAWFEQFLRLKAKLEAEGLFDAARKRPLPARPCGIGVVTSLGAAALHDVVTALRRRVPHVPVVLAPAAVQGPSAPADLARALESLYRAAPAHQLDVILLVRGGGAPEDLWAFNDEALARTIVRSPVPVISGVGHETDFTIADFCADLRAPTPTAAAELAAHPRVALLEVLDQFEELLRAGVLRRLDAAAQRLDVAASRLGRPSARMAGQHQRLDRLAGRLRYLVMGRLDKARAQLESARARRASAVQHRLDRAQQSLQRTQLRLELMDPRLVLRRGYALLTDTDGAVVSSAAQTRPGQPLRATLADGEVDLTVAQPRLI
ncbi:MAG TPA: exodeoxyribonuclease VII large subunit [Ramlibacter sp.]|nr:exodeoxyribonuclease VII large subunit [Ramlibacter sp.]